MMVQSAVAGSPSWGGWFPPDALPQTSTPDPPPAPVDQKAEDLNAIFAQMAEESIRRRAQRDQMASQARGDYERAQEEARLKSAALQQSMSGLWYASFSPAQGQAAPVPAPPPPQKK